MCWPSAARDDRRRDLEARRRRGGDQAFAGRDHRLSSSCFPTGASRQTAAATDDIGRERPCAASRHFDDCQALVKDMFNDHAFRAACRCRVSTRSIGRASWPRSAIISRRRCRSAADRPSPSPCRPPISGDMFAGYAAKRMGLPIDRLVVATNDNDILRAVCVRRLNAVVATTRRRWTSSCRRISSGCYSRQPAATPARCAAMDGLKRTGFRLRSGGATGKAAHRFSAGRRMAANRPKTIRRRLAATGCSRSAHRDGHPCHRYAACIRRADGGARHRAPG